jgi:hypothetical protein
LFEDGYDRCTLQGMSLYDVQLIQQVVVQSYSERVFIDKKLNENIFSTTIDVSQLPKDTYLLRVYNGKNWYTQKLLITK